MCIVAIKPAGTKRPKDEQLTAMCQNNPDGFGYVTYNGTKLVIYKTMDMDKYVEKVKQIPNEQPVIYHARIATHGSVQVKNCHPFLSDDKQWAFAHNGILSIQNEKDMTDSETFFKRLAIPLLKAGYKPNDNGVFDKMVDCVIGYSKFAFMDNNGLIYTYGNFTKDNGIYYSNQSYIPYKQKYGWDKQPYGCMDEWDEPFGTDDYDMLLNDLKNDAYYNQDFFNKSLGELYDEYKVWYGGTLDLYTFQHAYHEVCNEIANLK